MTLTQEQKIVEIETIRIENRIKRIKVKFWKQIVGLLVNLGNFFEGIIKKSRDRKFKIVYLIIWLVFILLVLAVLKGR